MRTHELAKFAYGLICKVYAHLLERGYIREGDLVADPFAGCSVGGIVAAANGLRWIGVELEQSFVDLAGGCDCTGVTKEDWTKYWARGRQSRIRYKHGRHICPACIGGLKYKGDGKIPYQLPHRYKGNFELHEKQWSKMGKPYPVILQGDSREFSKIIGEAVSSVITSPPWTDIISQHQTFLAPHQRAEFGRNENSASTQAKEYGATEGQIGAMKEGSVDQVVSSIITSPPHTRDVEPHRSKPMEEWRGTKKWGGPHSVVRAQGYPRSKGQIGAMKEGKLEEVVGSIVTTFDNQSDIEYNYRGGVKDASKNSVARTGNQKNVRGGNICPRDCERNEGVRGSNLQAVEGDGDNPLTFRINEVGTPARKDKTNQVLAGQETAARDGRRASVKDSGGETLSLERRQGSSPLSQQSQKGEVRDLRGASESRHPPQRLRPLQRRRDESSSIVRELPHEASQAGILGCSEGREGTTEVKRASGVASGIITSPPWEKAQSGGGIAPALRGESDYPLHEQGGRYQGYQAEQVGSTEGQIGQEQAETYWGSCMQVYQSCYHALRGGGTMAIVVKSFVRGGKIIDLPSQTLELLIAIGFEPLERIRAWMTSPVTQKSLMPDVRPDYVKARKSFFRRLYERKHPENAIDYEIVLIVQKPEPHEAT